MSYWYDFEVKKFKIEPPVTGELSEDGKTYWYKWSQDNDDREGYWVITEDGQYIDQEEHIGGNNSDFEEELQVICDDLKKAGYKVNGTSAYCGEDTIDSYVGIVRITDNEVCDEEAGILSQLLKEPGIYQ